ncbi:uncharacterized protein LOC105436842 [Strongylocentrotus purpuratus]|uniref:Uncharacterized protein n=1 Tax=Strongylocentrotus purpuratus TaxID=7668 RepID=A0A7M7N5V6_STRPU|nr:uncharacterized protein LOC105436842 [Strongylocentrotus purpuratus]XP_030831712.1 uncharacterized protein LOC105436842 [Strongylocentrotus purpuratus]
MNPQHQRSLSSASIDNKAFREAISKMRNDVFESKAETQRVRDQLNCLVMLVKRAWTGDQAAVVHVSNIVGAPIPSFLRRMEDGELHGEFKNAAVHHWAVLSIGLLNRHYQQLEAEGLAYAKARLQHRQEYLDQQLQAHRETLMKEKRLLKKRILSANAQPRLPEQVFQPANSRVYRDESHRGNTEMAAHPGNLIEFLYPGKKIGPQPKQNRLVQRRYSQPGLYDSSGVVEKPKRPVSAIHQRKTDAERARARSAVKTVTVKGDRPLKYETTRPVSAKNISTTFITDPAHSSSNMNNSLSRKPRAKSAKAYIGLNSRSLHSNERRCPAPTPTGQDYGSHDNNEHAEDMGHVSPFRDGVTSDLKKIELMEEDFRKTATMLQHKLGISNGVV